MTNKHAANEREAWIDRHGDVWTLGDDGLMHTPETRPFPRQHVEKKWGPLSPTAPTPAAPKCGAQTYWHEEGVQRARWCDKAATTKVRSLDGSYNLGCDEHGALMIDAGATLVTPLEVGGQ